MVARRENELKVPFLDLKAQYNSISGDIEASFRDIIENCCFIGGKYVNEFERNMEQYLGIGHVIGCANGTDALTLALRACNIKPGDEVITTPFSFFATAEAIASIGAIPVFVDVRENDYNIDPDKIEEAISTRTKAILPVHIFGAPCDMDKIMAIAKRHGLRVIEDDAQAIGSEYKTKKAGTLGDIGCFSFYPTKNLGGAGDGGMITTDDEELSVALMAYREHGAGEVGAKTLEFQEGVTIGVHSDEKITELYNPYKYFNYVIGYNSRLDALQAAVLSIKLRHLEEYNSNRSRIALKYYEGLTSKVKLPSYSSDIKPCWHQFVIRSDSKTELCAYLSEHDVGNGTFYPVPLHKQKAFNNNNSRISGNSLSVAEMISSQTVCLPVYPEMTDDQIQYVIDTVNRFYGE